MKTLSSAIAFTLLATALTGCINIEKHTTSSEVKPYPLGNKCLVSGEKFDGDGVRLVSNGQEVRLCCKDCVAEFNKTPGKFLAKLN